MDNEKKKSSSLGKKVLIGAGAVAGVGAVGAVGYKLGKGKASQAVSKIADAPKSTKVSAAAKSGSKPATKIDVNPDNTITVKKPSGDSELITGTKKKPSTAIVAKTPQEKAAKKQALSIQAKNRQEKVSPITEPYKKTLRSAKTRERSALAKIEAIKADPNAGAISKHTKIRSLKGEVTKARKVFSDNLGSMKKAVKTVASKANYTMMCDVSYF